MSTLYIASDGSEFFFSAEWAEYEDLLSRFLGFASQEDIKFLYDFYRVDAKEFIYLVDILANDGIISDGIILGYAHHLWEVSKSCPVFWHIANRLIDLAEK